MWIQPSDWNGQRRNRGSRESRIPSPQRLIAGTVATIAPPAGINCHGASFSTLTFRATFGTVLQLAVDGCLPSPRNERPTAGRIVAAWVITLPVCFAFDWLLYHALAPE